MFAPLCCGAAAFDFTPSGLVSASGLRAIGLCRPASGLRAFGPLALPTGKWSASPRNPRLHHSAAHLFAVTVASPAAQGLRPGTPLRGYPSHGASLVGPSRSRSRGRLRRPKSLCHPASQQGQHAARRYVLPRVGTGFTASCFAYLRAKCRFSGTDHRFGVLRAAKCQFPGTVADRLS